MNKKAFAQMARKIMQENIYLSLGTYSTKSGPWVSPLYYCVDKNYNFYYASQLTSVHAKNIFQNSSISFAIFDSQVPEGMGRGVQIAGKASLVKKSELKDALKVYKSKFLSPELLSDKNAPYKLFRLTPKQIFVRDPEANVDRRVRVDVKEF